MEEHQPAFLQPSVNWWDRQPLPYRFYWIGYSVLGVFLLLVVSHLGATPATGQWGLLWFGWASFFVGTMLECSSAFKTAWANAKTKWIVGAGAAVIWWCCHLFARHQINAVTALSPEHFSSSLLLSASIAAPFVLAIFLFIAAFPIAWFVDAIPAVNRAVKIARTFGVFATTFAALLVMFGYASISDEIVHLQRWLVASLDHYAVSHCQNVTPTERSLDIDDGLVSVAYKHKGDWYFEVRVCQLPPVQ